MKIINFNIKKRLVFISLLLIILLVIFGFAAICMGSEFYSISEIFSIFNEFRNGRTSPEVLIVMQIRFPRIILAFLTGGVLALSGCIFQGLLRNPLADPYITGTSSGAALGACFGIFMGFASGTFTVVASAFIGAFIITAVVYAIASRNGRINVSDFLICGVAAGAFASSLVALFMSVRGEDASKIIFWLMGSLSGREDWNLVRLFAAVLVVPVFILFCSANNINLISLGDENAHAKGVDIEKVKKIAALCASLLTALAVSAAGTIGFAGFMVPHFMRKIFGADHRILIPASLLGGGLFLILADTVARSVSPGNEIPVGVVTSLLGAPFFILVMKKRV